MMGKNQSAEGQLNWKKGAERNYYKELKAAS